MTTWSIRVKHTHTHTHTHTEESCTRHSQLTDFCKPAALALKGTVHPDSQILLSSTHLHVTWNLCHFLLWNIRVIFFHRMKVEGQPKSAIKIWACSSHKAVISSVNLTDALLKPLCRKACFHMRCDWKGFIRAESGFEKKSFMLDPATLTQTQTRICWVLGVCF